jgi:hypothetical protein
MLTKEQLHQITHLGIEESEIESQIKNFKEGFGFANLAKPATIGDGIIQATDENIESWSKTYDDFAKTAKIVKFVPASGAATRMFKSLYEYVQNPAGNKETDTFLTNLNKFAFFAELKKTLAAKGVDIVSGDKKEIVKGLIETSGLNYGNLPKGLLQFHAYADGSRTPAEEHVAEGFKYAFAKEKLKLHFTISPEHESIFVKEFAALSEKYKSKGTLDIKYSFQKKSTDTLAVDMNNEPVLDKNGLLTFRPGGHGALLENLNDIDADLIFVKNIDNVVPDYLCHVTVKYKKALAGLLVSLKTQIADILSYLEWHDTYTEKHKNDIAAFLKKYLDITVPENLDNTIFAGYVKSKLDKPIRVCGMVKNAGEPGGGPFWVLNRKGEPRLQIIESSQVDPNNSKQQEILKSATHFNPVDLVCYTKDYSGHKFNLLKYRDSNSGFITEKSINGVKIKAQELPGLWNGAMSHWITLFVEVPLETFNPVKTITDLLRKEHQPQ